MSTMEADNSDDMDREVFEEVDPSGRFGRYGELLGSGAFKKVYRGFDQQEGIEVAWNKVKLCKFIDNQKMIDRLFSEVELLRSLKHGSIMSLFDVWRDEEKNTLNFITEVCVSGDLRAYRKMHKKVSLKAVKWCKHILKGLSYMHILKVS
ncbi:hypothetical protein Leryth_011135 [Lithospermum erythrorhizon]|nr:hypothetical protein Leryth_011135 [Lithospermum erythrorhizon]